MSILNDNPLTYGPGLGGTRPIEPTLTDAQNAPTPRRRKPLSQILFTFSVMTGGGEKQVYRSAFEAMKKQCIEGVAEDANLVAKVQYGNQMDAHHAMDDNQGMWPGLMKACDCAAIQLDWQPQNRVTYDILVEVSQVTEESREGELSLD